jgi:ABC-type transport system involved in multi-copper enzyme maturation permease subunit
MSESTIAAAADAPAHDGPADDGAAQSPEAPPGRPRLVTAELRKILTTNTWWLFGIFVLLGSGLALLVNVVSANHDLDTAQQFRLHRPDFTTFPAGQRPTASQQQELLASWQQNSDVPAVLVKGAANVYTSGQYVALALVLLVGVLMVTNEFAHQTATATFLGTPRRARVIGAKFAAAAILAAGYWAVSTIFDVGVGALDFGFNGYGFPFTDPVILRAVGMNLLGFVLWAVLGVGFGVLIRNQIGAAMTAVALYILNLPAALLVFAFLRQVVFKTDAVYNYIVLLPGVASLVMVSPDARTYGNGTTPLQWWAGGLVLTAYTIAMGIIGTTILRRRDIT